MTEAEKEAERIIEMFQPYNQEYQEGTDMMFTDDKEGAKQCAIIQVNETMETLFKLKVLSQDKTLIYKEIGFLKQVKQAIENK